jgi:hypothetical protein
VNDVSFWSSVVHTSQVMAAFVYDHETGMSRVFAICAGKRREDTQSQVKGNHRDAAKCFHFRKGVFQISTVASRLIPQ